MKDVEIFREPMELFNILKIADVVDSGGEAKHVIAEGMVKVNGEIETRKRKKIVDGDIIEFGDETLRVNKSSETH